MELGHKIEHKIQVKNEYVVFEKPISVEEAVKKISENCGFNVVVKDVIRENVSERDLPKEASQPGHGVYTFIRCSIYDEEVVLDNSQPEVLESLENNLFTEATSLDDALDKLFTQISERVNTGSEEGLVRVYNENLRIVLERSYLNDITVDPVLKRQIMEELVKYRKSDKK